MFARTIGGKRPDKTRTAHCDTSLGVAAQHRFVRGVVGWLPLVDATVGELIDRYASNPALRGSALSVHEQRRILGETAIEAYAL